MKTFFTLTFIAAGICIASAAVTVKEHEVHLKAVAKKCQEAHKVDDDTYNALVKMRKVPESEEGKCMVACFMKEEGHLLDGKFNLDSMMKSNTHKWEDAAIVEKANKAAKECVEEASSDDRECLKAAKLVTCFLGKADKEGIPPIHM